MIKLIFGFLVALAGAAILGASAFKYRQLIRLLRKASYRITKKNIRRQTLQQCLSFLFAGSYLVGAMQALTTQLDVLFIFESILFFACAVFFHAMISEQLDMEHTLQQRKLEILRTFVNAIDRKDAYTRGHSEHVYELVRLLHGQLPEPVRKSVNLPKLLDAALLHDIGKIGISDDILKKTDALTPAEWAIMRNHAREGKHLLDDTCFTQIADWVLYHHERMDGNGYERLPGDQIPLESRMIAIADTFSALTTNREYRVAIPYKQAIAVMKNAAGTQLDADLLALFLRLPTEQLLRNGEQ